MASSRTGTAAYKRARTRALREAQANGQTRCPHCGVRLDYHRGRQPNSAEPDHVVPYARGGADDPDNFVVLCRRCNQSKGANPAPKAARRGTERELQVSRNWFE